MASKTFIVKDAPTQAESTHSLQVPPTDSVLADNSEAVEKLPRKKRRQNFWRPIKEKIDQKREQRQSNPATAGARSADYIPSSTPHKHAPHARPVDHPVNCQDHNRRREYGRLVIDCANDGQVPDFSASPQIPQGPRQNITPYRDSGRDGSQRFEVPAPRGQFSVPVPQHPPHAFLDNLRNSALHVPPTWDGQIGIDASNPAYVERQCLESQSSATHVGEMTWSPTIELPVVVVTPCDGQGHSHPARAASHPAEVHHSVLGIAPSTPYIPSVEDDHLDAELESEPLQLSIPDPGDSNRAPRTENNEWDGETHVAEGPEASRPSTTSIGHLLSNDALVKMLLSKTKQIDQGPDRSWTFPGREPSPSPASFKSDDASTLVDEPIEFLSKTDHASREALRPVKSFEKFLLSDSTDTWVPLS